MEAPLFLIVVFGLMYVLVIRPQKRQIADHRALVGSLEVGDEVVTTGGMHGIVVELDEHLLALEIADGVVVRMERAAVAGRPADEAIVELDDGSEP